MANNEGTPGAVDNTSASPSTETSWYHVYVPFNSGVSPPPSGFTADVALTAKELTAAGLPIPVDPKTGLALPVDTNNCLPDPTQPQPLGSFLHIGSMDPSLLTISGITDPNNGLDAAAQATFTRALNLTSHVNYGFLDDYRQRDDDIASTLAQRQAESARLYNKGGWRDHTDGNRITTTAGDKVEVIGGNHVMMILGRPTRDNNLDNSYFTGTPPNQHQIETSGGLSYSNDAGPGHIEEVRWVTRSAFGDKGTWMVREKKYLSDEVSIGAGLTHESFVGIGVEINSGTAYSYHGAIENMPDELLNNADVNLPDIWRDENAVIPTQKPPLPPAPYFSDMTSEETLVASIQKNSANVYGGSNPVPTQKTVEYTNLDSTYSNSTVGTVTEYTTVNTSKHEETTVTGSNFEKTTINGNTSEVTLIAGSKEETELMIGPVEAVAMYMGLKEEISLKGSNELTIDIGATKEELTVWYTHSEWDLSALSIEGRLGDSISIAAGTKVEIDNSVVKTTIDHTHIGVVHNILGALVSLG